MASSAAHCVSGLTDNSLVLCILGVSNHSRNRTGSCMSAPWFSVATHFKGTTEVHGSVDDPKILEMYRLAGHPEVEHDETPWCAAFVGACLSLSGYRGTESLLARSYHKFGQDLKQEPRRGCIVVLWRGDPKASTGHVAFYDRDDGDHVVLLGGNQGDAVTTRSFPKGQVLAYRWPTETAPLPANTPLPNILTIDPGNAPPHLLNGGPGAAAGLDLRREPRATDVLSQGSEGPDVRALQAALSARNFQVGPIDGEFGPLTQAAVASFQTVKGLPVTGSAGAATLQALGLAPSAPPIAVPGPRPFDLRVPAPAGGGGRMTIQPQSMQPQAMQSQDVLKLLFDTLIAQQAASAAAAPTTQAPAGSLNTAQLLQTVLAALAAKQPPAAQPATPATSAPSDTVPPILSPIDSWMGGQALAGKKTALAVLGYTVLSVLQAVGVAGTATGTTATTTGQILTTLIAAFGGLGGLAKIDRVVKSIGVIAARPPAATKLE
jgi:uncharacterized protein (TIGR02594 family)